MLLPADEPKLLQLPEAAHPDLGKLGVFWHTQGASQKLLRELQKLLAPLEQWTQKEQTQAEVEVFILDNLYELLPSPPFTELEKQAAAHEVYRFVWDASTAAGFAGIRAQ